MQECTTHGPMANFEPKCLELPEKQAVTFNSYIAVQNNLDYYKGVFHSFKKANSQNKISCSCKRSTRKTSTTLTSTSAACWRRPSRAIRVPSFPPSSRSSSRGCENRTDSGSKTRRPGKKLELNLSVKKLKILDLKRVSWNLHSLCVNKLRDSNSFICKAKHSLQINPIRCLYLSCKLKVAFFLHWNFGLTICFQF